MLNNEVINQINIYKIYSFWVDKMIIYVKLWEIKLTYLLICKLFVSQ